jgi:hypothetical protein
MWSAVIVGPQPPAEGSAALGVGAIQPRIGPLLEQGLVEPLDLAVELLWSSGLLGGGVGGVGCWGGSGEQGLEDHRG